MVVVLLALLSTSGVTGNLTSPGPVRADDAAAPSSPGTYADLVISHQHMRVYLGSMEYALARLATTCGENERAAAHFEAALETNRRIGARPHLARAQTECAGMLLDDENASHADRERAHELLAQAEATARELGMSPLLERIHQVGTQGKSSKS